MVSKIVPYVAVSTLFLTAWVPAVGMDKSAKENAVVHDASGQAGRDAEWASVET